MYQRCRGFAWFYKFPFDDSVAVSFQCFRCITPPFIGSNGAPIFDHCYDCLSQLFSCWIRFDNDSYSTDASFSFVLDCDEYQYLSKGTSTSLSWLNSAKKHLIDFYCPLKPFTT